MALFTTAGNLFMLNRVDEAVDALLMQVECAINTDRNMLNNVDILDSQVHVECIMDHTEYMLIIFSMRDNCV